MKIWLQPWCILWLLGIVPIWDDLIPCFDELQTVSAKWDSANRDDTSNFGPSARGAAGARRWRGGLGDNSTALHVPPRAAGCIATRQYNYAQTTRDIAAITRHYEYSVLHPRHTPPLPPLTATVLICICTRIYYANTPADRVVTDCDVTTYIIIILLREHSLRPAPAGLTRVEVPV